MKPDEDDEDIVCINIYCACPVQRLGDGCCEGCRTADPEDDEACSCGHHRCEEETSNQ